MREARKYLLRRRSTFSPPVRIAVLGALLLGIACALSTSYLIQKVAVRHRLDDFWSPGLSIILLASSEVFLSVFLAIIVLIMWRGELRRRIPMFAVLVALGFVGLRIGINTHYRYLERGLLVRRADLISAFEEKFRKSVFLIGPANSYPVRVADEAKDDPVVIRFAPLRTRNLFPNKEIELILTDPDGTEVARKRLPPQFPDASELVSVWRVVPGHTETVLSVQRRGWLCRLFGGYLTFIAMARPVTVSPGPNFVLISYDTLRADHLGCYGYGRDTSPCVDAIASQSVLFENASSQASSTLPSHMSIMTSLYPANHRMINRGFDFPEIRLCAQIETLAEYLRGAGYLCTAFTEGGFVSSTYGFDRGFDIYDNGESETPFATEGLIDETFAKAEAWLRTNIDSKFFMFIHTYQTHYPYTPPPSFDTMFESGYDGPLGNDLTREEIFDIRGGKLELTDVDIHHIIALYDGEIRYADRFVSCLSDLLDELQLAENTVVIFTSDHGEELNDHGIIPQHGETIYQDQIHVPLMFYCPAKFPPLRVELPVELNDIMPTVLELAGIDTPPNLEGKSLVPLLEGGGVQFDEQRLIFAETEVARVSRSARKGNLKYIRNFDDSTAELYDLSTDPGEQNNVADRFPEEIRHMQAEMDAWVERQRQLGARHKTAPQTAPLPQAVRERLKALGYL